MAMNGGMRNFQTNPNWIIDAGQLEQWRYQW